MVDPQELVVGASIICIIEALRPVPVVEPIALNRPTRLHIHHSSWVKAKQLVVLFVVLFNYRTEYVQYCTKSRVNYRQKDKNCDGNHVRWN